MHVHAPTNLIGQLLAAKRLARIGSHGLDLGRLADCTIPLDSHRYTGRGRTVPLSQGFDKHYWLSVEQVANQGWHLPRGLNKGDDGRT